VGSTNLNLASFVGNYELDVAVEDAGFAAAMEHQYRDDLMHATEIVLQRRRRSVRPVPAQAEGTRARRARSGSAGRAAAGAVRFGSAVGTALVRPGELGFGNARIMGGAAVALAGLAAVGVLWPKVIAWPLAAIALWFAIAFLIRAWRGRRRTRSSRGAGA
jgi:cardiolipin synthase